MDTRHLRAALAVAEHGSFTKAAKALFMAQSTLSRQVAALERGLGAHLFVRGPRNVSLTDGGKAFLPHAENVIEQVQKAEQAVKNR